MLLNKIDRVDAATRAALAEALPAALQLCAHAPEDVARLHAALIEAFDASQVDDVLEVPFTEGHLLGEIRAHARVLAETYTETGALLRVRALPAALERWRGQLSTVRPITSPTELLAVIRRHGLELQAEDADFDRTGLDFLVVHARDEAGTPWIVRTPRRPEVTASAYVEARVLRLVRPRLPVAAPDWRVHAPDVIAYPRIAGTPAVTVTPEGPRWNILDPAAPSEAFIESFARALAALQAIAPEEASRAGVPTSTIAEVRAALSRSMDATREALQPSDTVWQRWQRWLADDAMWPQHVALVHGDLHPGHMLLGTDGRLVGILDWTEARVTDPSIDLALFCGCFGRSALARLVERFAQAGGTTWPRLVEHAAERWAAFPVLIAEWALRTDNATVLEHARGQLAAVTAETTA
ncbi:phosphotransferase [Nannocystis pusilla]|uniref:macrolide 2'-phosphotransferase n=1 Tax=Nannocystis pusilla TaxID=889268 RepID=UPI003DA50EA8